MGAARWVYVSLAIALAFASSGALSEVYRWKDSNGKLHFGDRPDSTDPQVVKEVIVPSPNLATGLKGMPPTAGGKPKAVAGDEPTVHAGCEHCVEQPTPNC